MSTHRPPTRDSSLFLDACAVLNYVKPLILNKLLSGRPLPDRVTIIKSFLIKCNEKGLKLQSSDTAYMQAKNYREHFLREFTGNFSPRTLDRVISASEYKIKSFMARMGIHDNLSNRHYADVESFFKRFETDARMIELWKRKCRNAGITFSSTLPDKTDMEILAQALTLKNLIFVTTDGHFSVLYEEIEKTFGITVITDKNALERLREWEWL